MDMVVKAMRERARCIALLKKKYPGLPYYDVDTLPVLMKLSGAFNSIHRDSFDDRLSPEEEIRVRRWEKVFRENSYLASLLGRDLDWMYEFN